MTELPADCMSGDPDVYFSEGYGRAEQAAGSGEWLDLQDFGGLWRMPVHLREADGLIDAISPYGYAGLFASPRLSGRDIQSAWNDATKLLVSRGASTLVLRQTPLLPDRVPRAGRLTIVKGHPTVCLDTTNAQAIWEGMEGRCRTSVRKAQRRGYEASVRPVREADLLPGSPFRRLYEDAMERRSAAKRYFFPDDYYRILLDELGQRLLIVEVSAPQGGIAAASLLMRHGRTLHYHLSGADVAAGRDGATNLGLWEAANWAAGREMRRFHLGGGVGPDDSLFKFKRSLGGRILGFAVYGFVLDADLYRQSIVEGAVALRRSPESLEHSSHFPPFRTPG